MTPKTVLLIVFLSVLGILMASLLGGSILKSSVVFEPFSKISDQKIESGDIGSPIVKNGYQGTSVQFVDANLEKEWIPWIIQQASILIGALSLLVFGYAGFQLVVHGDNTEQFTASVKMIVFGVAGIALAAFSYTIVANLLKLFNT